MVLLKDIKNIFCVNEYSPDCNKCSLCHLIDINNLPSLKIIEPDGDWIKKNQIIELKNLFSKEPIYTKESIYIIKNAHLLNKEAANTMLKFLEEPASNVIGFFLTNQKDKVLLTIQSRCQHLECNFEMEPHEKYNLTLPDYTKIHDIVMQYLESYQKHKEESILLNRQYLDGLEKKEIISFLQMLLDYFKEKMDAKIKCLENISLDKDSLPKLHQKVELIIEILNEINYNVNTDLLMDKLIIEMEAIDNENI